MKKRKPVLKPCDTCHGATQNCPLCGSACIAAKRLVRYFDVDQEPFCGDDCEFNNYNKEEIGADLIGIYIQYCTTCRKVVDLWTDFEQPKQGDTHDDSTEPP